MIGVEECVNDAMSLINKFINWGARLARPCESAGLAAVVAWRQVHHSWRNFRPSPVRKKTRSSVCELQRCRSTLEEGLL